MGDMRIDTKDINKLIGKLKGLNVQGFCEDTVAELGNRTLRDVKQNTPVGVYEDGKQGGTLRKNWFVTPVKKESSSYVVEVKNNTHYAAHVENGHRTRLRKNGTRGWVAGRFMLLKGTKKVEKQAPRIIKARWKQFIGDA